MKENKFTPEQIIRKLREGEGLIAWMMSVDQTTKQLLIEGLFDIVGKRATQICQQGPSNVK